ncbi:transposase [Streptomyces sp. PU_AKi4]|uniref:transposase n=1 Tax=Streptomyces sp. PU_AKi4 TaxID=2800809 RepID=UPI0035239922
MGRRRLHRPSHRLDQPAPRSGPRHRPPQRRPPRFQVLPHHRGVERSFAWLLCSWRLVRAYERHTDTSESVILWSMTMLMVRLAAQRRLPGPGGVGGHRIGPAFHFRVGRKS